MNRMKAPSYIMKYRELILKVPERKMNTSLDDEGTIADNEGIKGRILGFFLQTAPHTMVLNLVFKIGNSGPFLFAGAVFSIANDSNELMNNNNPLLPMGYRLNLRTQEGALRCIILKKTTITTFVQPSNNVN